MARLPEKVPVKLETEDFLPDELGPLNKRSKPSSASPLQWSTGTHGFPVTPLQYNPLDEPSPLGLRLRKSPSLVDLIQTRLSQDGASSLGAPSSENHVSGNCSRDAKGAVPSCEKLKASNFPASLLRIGSWEYASRYEGDLVAKCYFAKHKLVWEVLDGVLKSKLEVQWSDIMGLRAACPENGSGSLTIALARPPLFFRETNPQPRKHTLWQAAPDFTDGQASMFREHFLQCPVGVLNKHFQKLIQCDLRLNLLSQQPFVVLDSPYFDLQASAFEGSNCSDPHGFDQFETNDSGFNDLRSSCVAQSSSMRRSPLDPVRTTEHLSPEAPSPSSVMDMHAIDGDVTNGDVTKGTANLGWQPKLTGLRPSMSICDLMNHIGHHISGPAAGRVGQECREALEEIANCLLSDSQLATAAASDEKSLMSRVNSLCCLLQDDPGEGAEGCII